MSRERQIADLMLANPALVALLPGGIYTDQEVGIAGIRRGESSPTKEAFGPDGYLRACALVRQQGTFPYNDLNVLKDRIVMTSQMVHVYFYEERGHDEIDAAKDQAYAVLQGVRLPSSYPIWWVREQPHMTEMGPTQNSTTLRQEWQVITVKRPVS